MIELEKFKLLAIALAIGLLIGLERGWQYRNKGEGSRIAGLRTHGLISLLGGLWGILAQQTEPLLLGLVFLGLTLVLLLAFSKRLDRFEDFSITGVIGTLTTFTLGVLTVYGHIALAAAVAVVISSLLGFKPLLHGWIKKLEEHELHATLKLLLISVVILPVLPNRNFGSWAVLNPYQIWWMVVMIAAISYLGYFAIKIVGNQHGPVLTGLLGGVVSSTAVTINLSRLVTQDAMMANALASGILTACATMFLRTLLLTYILNPLLFIKLLPALLLMGGVTYLAALFLWYRARNLQTNGENRLENPFQLGMALKFGALLMVIMLLSRVIQSYYGDLGTYFLAAASGIADVDPITLTITQMSKEGLAIEVAQRAILIAVSVNSIVKSLIASIVGSWVLGLRVCLILTSAVVAGLLI
jgi:uncharacterized membrane protein (DUF4010 family)